MVEWFGLQFEIGINGRGVTSFINPEQFSTLGTAQVGTAQTLDHHVQLIFGLDNGIEDQERSPARRLTGPTTRG
mgnify:CR=1 FL=1